MIYYEDEDWWRHTWADLVDDDHTIHRPVEEAVFAIIYLEEHPTDERDRAKGMGQTTQRNG